MMVRLKVLVLLASALWCACAAAQPYYMYIANESEDTVVLVSFDGHDLQIAERIPVGNMLTEIEGPHGLTVSPDGRFWFVSMAHGQPFGKIVRYSTIDNRKTGEVTVGLFPASMAISPLTGLLHVVNYNLHGAPEPSSISVVDPDAMTEVARVETGIMPHGSQFTPDGLVHYSVAMMSHELIEQDGLKLDIRRRLPLGAGVRPTWVAVHLDRPQAYVAGNGSDEILIVDLNAWQVTERISAPGAPYNLAVTPDGRSLVATLKSAGAIGFYDINTAAEDKRIESAEALPHGIALAPDGRYAFVTSENIGHAPGTVEAIDLTLRERVARVSTGQQAGGIVFWKR
ncbi:MAG: YncE family protein [Bacteroidota bacterium]|nr:YncE family protein [Bacteroidota bacterium]MDE2835345.1 YncE family protein [Bacteroidota bacterium]